MKGTKNIINYFKSYKYRHNHKQNLFPFYGIDAYMGGFGSGKTLSCVNKCYDILTKYPNSIFITNTFIKGISNKTFFFTSADELVHIMKDNIKDKEECGYIIFIDELHVVLSDIFRTSDADFLTYLSQLRKLGVYIIGTCQLYNKCPKTVRDYLRLSGRIIFCNKVLGGITINQFVNMDDCEETSNLKLNYTIQRFEWFFHTVDLYESYDTFAVVSQIKNLMSKGSVKNELPINN